MFYYVSGTVAHVEPYLAVIDCGGVGYACKTTSTTISQLQVGKASKLYTYLHVGEGIFDLYGFATQGELGSFKQLIGVSGVGPKAALAILSVCTPQGLAMAVITGDEKALIAAPGIGKKIAQRIILELKDKLTKEQQEIGMPTAPGIVAGEKSKAVEAAHEHGVDIKVGNIVSNDTFYAAEGTNNADGWRRMGALAVEMEAAGLYANAAYAHKRALCICTISDHIYRAEALSSEQRQTSFTQMMEIALDTAVKMAQL